MKGMSIECYCEVLKGVVEVFMKVLLVHLDLIHVVPQVPSHLGEVHKGDIENGVQGSKRMQAIVKFMGWSSLALFLLI